MSDIEVWKSCNFQALSYCISETVPLMTEVAAGHQIAFMLLIDSKIHVLG